MNKTKIKVTCYLLLPLMRSVAFAGIADTAALPRAYHSLHMGSKDSSSPSFFLALPNKNKEDEDTAVLNDIAGSYEKSGDEGRAFKSLLRTMRFRKMFRAKKNRVKLYSDLATISARLKLYPLAMQCYYETIRLRDENGNVTGPYNNSQEYSDTISQQPDAQDPGTGVAFAVDTAAIKSGATAEVASEPVQVNNILSCYEDGKEGSRYALLLQVKQPVTGKRRAFTGIDNVGHMFITLIKYNTDNSFVSRSFGFYPDKDNVLAATPLHPASPSFFKDDALHNWDEATGKFISHRRFLKIIRLLGKYEGKLYHLNDNNCTDFGLTVAAIGGIGIEDTQGKWPFGKGNNPANAGQSMLEGKIVNTDTGNIDGLFICTGKNAVVQGAQKN